MSTPARPSDGLLLVDKPAGLTSHDVVNVVRRAYGVRRVGHAGTLDPFATGLVVVAVGRVTRLIPFLDAEPKVYDAVVRFGVETDTGDPTGAGVRQAPPPETVPIRAVERLVGRLMQVPPAFSAKQVGGRRAYDAARRGEPLELAAAPIEVESWTVRGWDGENLTVRVACSGGTYVRALARDLGLLAGSAAHLAALRRVRSGRSCVADAVPLDAVRDTRPSPRPARDALAPMAVVTLTADELQRVLRGGVVPAREIGDRRAALVDEVGDVVAIAERCSTGWQPRVVLRDG